MSKKANTKVIGGFVLGALVLALATIGSLGSGDLFSRRIKCMAFFEGALTGLTVGSPVLYRGARIGSVTSIKFRYDVHNSKIELPVFFELDQGTIEFVHGDAPSEGRGIEALIERGLRAQLVGQSMITGVLSVQLDMLKDVPAKYRGSDYGYVEIPTAPSLQEQLEELFKELQKLPVRDLVDEVRQAVNGFNELVRSPDIARSIRDLDATLLQYKQLAADVGAQVEPVVAMITTTGLEARSALKQARDSISAVESTLNATLTDYRNLGSEVGEHIEPLATDLRATLSTARQALVQAEKTLQSTDELVTEDSTTVYRLNEALAELRLALRSIRELADYLQQHPDSLLRGK